MRTLKLYRHGVTMGTPPAKNDHLRAKRGQVHGWSQSAARRNTQFLRSVDETGLPTTDSGEPLRAIALTLTLKHCPPSPDHWHSLRRAYNERLRRLGLYRSHWVTEWQRRGVPHLHGAFWLPEGVYPQMLINHWCDLAHVYGALPRGQHATPIVDAVGWFKYLSKHASRGASHYQRHPENIPPEWKLKTGRVWGHTGPWPIREAIEFDIDDHAFFRLRRLYRRWRVADSRREIPEKIRLYLRKNPEMNIAPFWVKARESGAFRRVTQSKKMLKNSERKLSSVIGISEWIPEDVQMLALDWLRSEGHEIEC